MIYVIAFLPQVVFFAHVVIEMGDHTFLYIDGFARVDHLMLPVLK